MLILLAAVSALAAPPIDGTFRPSIPEAEIQARLDKSIDDAAAQFNWAIRAIARGRIDDQASACRTLALLSNETRTGVKCDDEAAIIRLTDNSEPSFARGNRTVDSVVRWEPGVLHIDWESDSGARRTEYRFRDEDHFDLTVRVYSDHLDTPMTFSIPYERTGPASGL